MMWTSSLSNPMETPPQGRKIELLAKLLFITLACVAMGFAYCAP